MHLFDIDIPGKISFKESETLSPGQAGTVVDTPAGRLGVAICYDLRFPELAMLYARRGVQLIVYPGAPQHIFFPSQHIHGVIGRCLASGHRSKLLASAAQNFAERLPAFKDRKIGL